MKAAFLPDRGVIKVSGDDTRRFLDGLVTTNVELVQPGSAQFGAELREATGWRVPIFVKMGASRVFDDVRLAAKAGADVVVVDGMEGGTGASPELLQEHTTVLGFYDERRVRADSVEVRNCDLPQVRPARPIQNLAWSK